MELIITIVGGLALFVYGMGLMSEGLTQIAGARLKSVLGYVTKNRVAAMLFDKEHPLRSYLREIVVSPHGNGDQLMMKAEKLCCRHGLQIKVARSASPYNGR